MSCRYRQHRGGSQKHRAAWQKPDTSECVYVKSKNGQNSSMRNPNNSCPDWGWPLTGKGHEGAFLGWCSLYLDWGTGHIRVTFVKTHTNIYWGAELFTGCNYARKKNFSIYVSKTVLPSLSSISLRIYIFLPDCSWMLIIPSHSVGLGELETGAYLLVRVSELKWAPYDSLMFSHKHGGRVIDGEK